MLSKLNQSGRLEALKVRVSPASASAKVLEETVKVKGVFSSVAWLGIGVATMGGVPMEVSMASISLSTTSDALAALKVSPPVLVARLVKSSAVVGSLPIRMVKIRNCAGGPLLIGRCYSEAGEGDVTG